jgi:excisionase family DNA binding protein
VTVPSEPLYLSVPETAKILRCHPVTVRRQIAAGALPAIRVGRAWRVPIASVLPTSKEYTYDHRPA